MNKINNLKKNIKLYHEENLKGEEIIEKILNNENQITQNEKINNKETNDIEINNLNSEKKLNEEENYDEEKINNEIELYNDNNNNEINNNSNENIDNNDENENYNENYKNENINKYNNESEEKINLGEKLSFDKNSNNNSTNLLEINEKMKLNNDRNSENNNLINSQTKNKEDKKLIENLSNKNINNPNSRNIEKSDSFSKLNIQLNPKTKNSKKQKQKIIKQNQKNDNLNKDLKQEIKNNQKLENEIIKNKFWNYQNQNNKKKEQNSNNIFYSIQIDKKIPNSFSEFGKYLITHIEKEENYRILYQSEIKQLKLKIKKIFSDSKTTDHCLLDYMLELWEKLDVSYFTRYQILKQLIKLPQLNLYSFLDRETEYLTNYFQITENIYNQIKKRESLKSKLQTKLNRNELNDSDKEELNESSNNLIINIRNFKDQFKGLDIIWKGMRYEWFMNYENYFYKI